MLISNFEQANLLAAIYQGAIQAPLWNDFLRLLRQDCLADCTMLLRQRGTSEIEISQSTAEIEDTEKNRKIPSFARGELIPFSALRAERVYALSEFQTLSPASLTERQSLLSEKYGYARIIQCQFRDYRAWIIMARKHGDFSPSQAALLSKISAHFKMSLEMCARMERERARQQISNEAARRLGFGWIALDKNGRIIDTDPQAERLLTNSKQLCRATNDRLAISPEEVQHELNRQLSKISQGDKPAPISIRLSADPTLDMLLVVPTKKQMIGGASTALLAYVHGDQRLSERRVAQMMQLFGLTPQEARVALAISRGRNIAECAAELNISAHTARLYSKRIYAKTRTRGQADLVRLLISSLAVFDEGGHPAQTATKAAS